MSSDRLGQEEFPVRQVTFRSQLAVGKGSRQVICHLHKKCNLLEFNTFSSLSTSENVLVFGTVQVVCVYLHSSVGNKVKRSSQNNLENVNIFCIHGRFHGTKNMFPMI